MQDVSLAYNVLRIYAVQLNLNLKYKTLSYMKTLIEKLKALHIYAVISWCRNNQDTLLLIGIGLLFQLIFFIGVIISGTCL